MSSSGGSSTRKAVAGAPDTKLVESAKASVVLDVVSLKGGDWKEVGKKGDNKIFEKCVPFSMIASAYDGTYGHLYGEQNLDEVDAKFSPLSISGRRIGASEIPVGVTLAVRADPKLIIGREVKVGKCSSLCGERAHQCVAICLINNKEGKKGKFVQMCGGMPCCATSYGPSTRTVPMRLYDAGMCHLAVPDVHLYGKNKDYGALEVKERDVDTAVHDTKFVNSSTSVADKSTLVNVFVETALQVEDRVSQAGNFVETRVEPMHVFSKNMYELSIGYTAKPVLSWDEIYVVLTCAIDSTKKMSEVFNDAADGIVLDMWYVPVVVMHKDVPHHLTPAIQHMKHLKDQMTRKKNLV
jgi:hypothetical protein